MESGGINESGSWTVPTNELLRGLMGWELACVAYVFGVPGRILTPYVDDAREGCPDMSRGASEDVRGGRPAGNALNDDVSMASGLVVVTVGSEGACFIKSRSTPRSTGANVRLIATAFSLNR